MHNNKTPFFEIQALHMQAGSFQLKDISFSLSEGDYLVLLGQSGSGKTLLLETLAGLQRLQKGSLWFQGKEITHDKIQHRPLGLLFQDHAVFPHMSVHANIGYACKHKSKTQRDEIISKLSEKLEISSLLKRMPAHLSGGEKQRVALARILAREPALLLLDEPLSSLDVELRKSVRNLLKRLNLEGQTIIHVTHDPEEAMSLASHVGILQAGTLMQFGTSEEVFKHPRFAFVASFSGIQNFLAARLEDGLESQIRNAYTKGGNQIKLYSHEPGGQGHLLIRGEDIILSVREMESSALNIIPGRVKDSIPLAQGVELHIEAGDNFTVVVSEESVGHLNLKPGSQVWMSVKASAVRFVSNA